MRAAPFVLLVAFPGQVTHFLLHQRFASARAPVSRNKLPTPCCNKLRRSWSGGRTHLMFGFSFRGDPAELKLHGSLLLDLYVSSHDSLPFLGRKQPSAHYGCQLESRYFHVGYRAISGGGPHIVSGN